MKKILLEIGKFGKFKTMKIFEILKIIKYLDSVCQGLSDGYNSFCAFSKKPDNRTHPKVQAS